MANNIIARGLDTSETLFNSNGGTLLSGDAVKGGYFVTDTLENIPTWTNVTGTLCYATGTTANPINKFYQYTGLKWEEADLGGNSEECTPLETTAIDSMWSNIPGVGDPSIFSMNAGYVPVWNGQNFENGIHIDSIGTGSGSGSGTVDQTYNPASSNAISGKALAATYALLRTDLTDTQLPLFTGVNWNNSRACIGDKYIGYLTNPSERTGFAFSNSGVYRLDLNSTKVNKDGTKNCLGEKLYEFEDIKTNKTNITTLQTSLKNLTPDSLDSAVSNGRLPYFNRKNGVFENSRVCASNQYVGFISDMPAKTGYAFSEGGVYKVDLNGVVDDKGDTKYLYEKVHNFRAIGENTIKIAELQTNVSDLTSSVTANQTNISTLSNTVSSLSPTVKQHTSSINSLQTSFQSVDAIAAQNKSSITSLQSDFSALASSVLQRVVFNGGQYGEDKVLTYYDIKKPGIYLAHSASSTADINVYVGNAKADSDVTNSKFILLFVPEDLGELGQRCMCLFMGSGLTATLSSEPFKWNWNNTYTIKSNTGFRLWSITN